MCRKMVMTRMRCRELRSGGPERGRSRTPYSEWRRTNLNTVSPDRPWQTPADPEARPLPSSELSENKSFGDKAEGHRPTILSCSAEWSRPECGAAGSGRLRDRVELRTARPARNSSRSPRASKHPGAAGIPCAAGWFRPDCDATDDGRPHKRTAPGKPEPVGR